MGTELQDLRTNVSGRLNLHPQHPSTANQPHKPCPSFLQVLFEPATEGIWNTSVQKDESCLLQLQLALHRMLQVFLHVEKKIHK